MRNIYKTGFLLSIACASIIAACFIPAFAQNPAYHDFADQRPVYGIINFWNVVSSLAFFLFGLIGLFAASKISPSRRQQKLQRPYTLFFTAAILIGIGSAYYHLNPSNQTLVVDRLMMVIAFMTFFCIIVAETISLNIARLLLLPLLVMGMIAVIYWYRTEQSGAGDLRPYAVAQFLPMILIPFILVLYKSARQDNAYIWVVIVLYLLAKLAEHFDADIYTATTLISGHSLKHLLASVAVLFFCLHFNKQRKILHD